MSLKTIDVNGEKISIGDKEFTLFKTITFDGETYSYDFTDLDFEEFVLIGEGLVNLSETLDSNVIVEIYDENEMYISFTTLVTQKNSSPSSTKYQRCRIYHTGLYWDYSKINECMNNNYINSDCSTIKVPYAIKVGMGKCKRIIIRPTVSVYNIISGTLQIYAR